MQRIERYGVIALVLLLVTIAAVSFWEEPTKPVTEKRESVAKASQVLPVNTPRDADRLLPKTARPTQESRARNQRAGERQREEKLKRQAELERQQRESAASALAKREEPVEVLDFPDALTPGGSEEPVVVSVNTQSTSGAAPAREVPPVQATPPKSKMRLEPPKAEPGQKEAAGGVYVVKANETLSEIAQKTLGSSKRWPELAALNGGSDQIYEGQKLRLPGAQVAAAPVKSAPAPVDQPKKSAARETKAGGTYVVKKGDMLSVIAQRELGSAKRWREIAKLNPSVDPDRLFEGTRLVMPSGAGSSTKVATASRPQSQSSSSLRRVR